MLAQRMSRQASPWHNELDRVFREFDRQLFGAGSEASMSSNLPALDIWEQNDTLHVDLEVPGYGMDQIELSMLDRDLTISGTLTEESTEATEGRVVHRRERRQTSFQRVVRIPKDFDVEAVEATLDHGVLMVTLPRIPETQPRKIEVTSTS